MLGLGQNLSSTTALQQADTPIPNGVTYTSDFSSGVDGFSAFFDNSPSAATLTGNQDFGGKTDVLKVSWSALEADGLFYVKRAISGFDNEVDPLAEISFDVYFEFSGATSVNSFVQAGSFANAALNMVSEETTANQWVTVTGSLLDGNNESSDGYIYIGFLDTTDKPDAGDNMYVTNIVFTFSDNS